MSNKQSKPQPEVSHGSVVDMSQQLLGLVVKRVFNVKADESADTRKINVQLDFSQVSIEWLLNKALRTIIIDTQRVLRQKGDEGLVAMEGNIENILLDPTPTRQKLTEQEKVRRLLGKLSEEDKKQLMDDLLTK